MAVKHLHVFERFRHGLSVGLRLTLKGDVCEENLRQAYALILKEHPALRLIVKMEESGAVFVPADCHEMQLEVDMAEGVDVEGCEAKLADWVNQPKDLTQCLHHFQYFPACANRPSHVLLICANHASVDGLGMLDVFASFCSYLGCILDGQHPQEPTPRPFKDIHALCVKPEGLEMPEFPNDLLPEPVVSDEVDLGEGKNTFCFVRKTMSPEATSALVATCRRHGFTVQGAICAAQMLSCAKAQKSYHPLPQKISYWTPVNMRSRVSPPFDASDCVCAPSLLWWYQTVYADQRIVDVGSTAGKKMRERLEEGFGFGVWKWAEEGNWTHMQKMVGTTLGIVPIQEKYGALEVEDLHFLVSNYGSGSAMPNTVSHFLTFAGSMRFSLGYSWPLIGHEFAEWFAVTVMQCLEVLAGADSDTMKVESFLGMV